MGVQPGKTLQWFIVSSVEINTETVEIKAKTPTDAVSTLLMIDL